MLQELVALICFDEQLMMPGCSPARDRDVHGVGPIEDGRYLAPSGQQTFGE